MSARYFCQGCGIELEHRQSSIERIAWLVNAACLVVFFVGLILRENFAVHVSDAMLFIAAALAVVSFVAGALLWAYSRHFVTPKAQQALAANASEPSRAEANQ